jgi:aquaporin Z
LSEFIGTALLVLVGLSIVIFNNGEGSPVIIWIPDDGWRRALTGFLFGTTGCLITLSPVGKISGAHINPIVSIAFWLKRKISTRHMFGFIVSQMAGAAVGALPLLSWGVQGASIGYGNTTPQPGNGGMLAAFEGEVLTSFCLVALIFFFTGHKHLRRYTPYMIPVLYCIMVYAEGRISGTSTNPARSFGPALVSRIWTCYWLYWAAPLTGSLIAVFLFEMPFMWRWKTEIPKLNQR